MEYVLKIGLNIPAGNDLRLVGDLDRHFVVLDRESGLGKDINVRTETSDRRRNWRIGHRRPENIVRPLVPNADEIDASLGIEIRNIAIRRACRQAGKNSDALLRIVS